MNRRTGLQAFIGCKTIFWTALSFDGKAMPRQVGRRLQYSLLPPIARCADPPTIRPRIQGGTKHDPCPGFSRGAKILFRLPMKSANQGTIFRLLAAKKYGDRARCRATSWYSAMDHDASLGFVRFPCFGALDVLFFHDHSFIIISGASPFFRAWFLLRPAALNRLHLDAP